MSTYGDPHWMEHPAVRYADALGRYRSASVILGRVRAGLLPHRASEVTHMTLAVLERLTDLWYAQEALHQHVLDRTPENVLIHEAIHRAHGRRRAR